MAGTSLKKIPSIVAALLLVPGVALASNDVLGLAQIRDLFCTGGLACSRSFSDLVLGVIHLLLLVSGSLAVLFIIIGGFFYITSAGNEEQAEQGRATLTNAVIGIVVIILSYAIVNVISNTIVGQPY